MQVKTSFRNDEQFTFLKSKGSFLGKLIYFLFLTLIIIALSQKCNYQVDEIWTYGLSNQYGSFVLNVSNGEKYEPGEKPFLEFLTVRPEHRFDYANVWYNQSNDVHPPFYYLLVHTICSFFPKQFSPWFAGVVNIFFALLTLLVLRKISRFYLDSSILVDIISLAYVLSAGILHSTTFLRMYVVAMFWVTFLTYCFIKRINNKFRNEKFFLVITSIVTLLGALTHYYCLLYSVLMFILYLFYLIIVKKYKETSYFCFAMLDTAIITYLIFPAMMYHVFFTNRGQEVLINAKNISDSLTRIKHFYLIIDQQLFGNMGLILILTVIALYLYILKFRKKDLRLHCYSENQKCISYIFLCLPAFLYFIVVSKISAFVTDRYLFPIYTITFCAVIFTFVNLLRSLRLPKNVGAIVAIFVLTIITIGSWINCKWEYLYLNSRDLLKELDAYSPVECVSVYANNWEILPLFIESKKYKSIQFISANNGDMVKETGKALGDISINSNRIILSLSGIPANMHHNYINAFLSKSKRLNSFKRLGSHQFHTSYILYNNLDHHL